MIKTVNLSTGEKADVFCGRPSRWENPYKEGRDGSREQVIGLYAELLLTTPRFRAVVKDKLADKSLGCFCKPRSCHGDLLLLVANWPIAC